MTMMTMMTMTPMMTIPTPPPRDCGYQTCDQFLKYLEKILFFFSHKFVLPQAWRPPRSYCNKRRLSATLANWPGMNQYFFGLFCKSLYIAQTHLNGQCLLPFKLSTFFVFIITITIIINIIFIIINIIII